MARKLVAIYSEKYCFKIFFKTFELTEPYDKYFNDGDTERNPLTEFNSNNTQLLTVEETKAKIASLQYIQDELKK